MEAKIESANAIWSQRGLIRSKVWNIFTPNNESRPYLFIRKICAEIHLELVPLFPPNPKFSSVRQINRWNVELGSQHFDLWLKAILLIRHQAYNTKLVDTNKWLPKPLWQKRLNIRGALPWLVISGLLLDIIMPLCLVIVLGSCPRWS